jgi:hypothetical protein
MLRYSITPADYRMAIDHVGVTNLTIQFLVFVI